MKQRFSSLDVRVISQELNDSLGSLRLSNAYDLSSRIFLFKFAKPNARQQLIIDSGFRCHLTKFSRTTATEPSAFVARLRKFLRTRRVTAVSQVGTDRVIEFTFGDGTYRLFLEFFAAGNVILTDAGLKILALLRAVPQSEQQEELRVGAQYLLHKRKNIEGVPEITSDRIISALKKASERNKAASEPTTKSKKSKKKSPDSLRKALATSLDEFPPTLIEHAVFVKNLNLECTVDEALNNQELLDQLVSCLKAAKDLTDQIVAQPEIKGYITARLRPPQAVTERANSQDAELDKENVAMMYEEFHPFRPQQFIGRSDIQILEYGGFNATVDEFFSSLESQKLESRLNERQEQAKRKLDAARMDHDKRLLGLQQVQELNVRKAQAIESNIQRVEEAIAAINGIIAQGMDWEQINQLVEMEQSRDNPVAKMVNLPLKLHENTVSLLLAEPDFEDDGYYEDDVTESEASSDESDKENSKDKKRPEADKRLVIDIDLSLSPWANAREYYGEKKSAAVKEKKTLDSSEKALKSAEQKVLSDLKKGLQKEADVLRPIRKQLWFEKFFYFITSEGYLVVGGRDDQQIDILYKRYFQNGDVWVHSDIKASTPFIVKNRPDYASRPIPLNSLAQAGTLAVATSTAWDSKAVMAAWWVSIDQVRKMDSTGHFLDPGSFVITGEKTYLPPAQLLLGLGMMFRISPESKARHTKHRIDVDRVKLDHTQKTPSSTTEDVAGKSSSLQSAEKDTGSETAAPSDAGEHNDSGEDRASSEASNSDDESEDEEARDGQFQNPLQPTQDNSLAKPMEELSLDEKSDNPSDIEGPVATQQEGPQASTAAPKVKSTPPVRGKKGKLAKAKAKYADQDDEERELAMKLLGAQPSQSESSTQVSSTKDSLASKEAEAQAQKERRRQQHQKATAQNVEAEEERLKALKSGTDLLSPEETEELKLVENFVGSPLPGDEMLDALVVCGPWDALGPKLRWRVKVQPGTQKRGKALQEIFRSWNKNIEEREKKRLPPEGEPAREEELQLRKEGEYIRNLREVETIGAIPVGKLRLVMAASKGAKDKGGGSGGSGGKGKGPAKGGGGASKGKGKGKKK